MALAQTSSNTCSAMSASSSLSSTSSSYSAKTVLNSVAAGYAAGIFGVLVGQPMDTAKVWLQTKGSTPVSPTVSTASSSNAAVANNVSSGLTRAPTSLTSSAPAANNMSTLSIPQQAERGFNIRSIRALYSGVSGPLMTVGMIQSINFAIYDSLRRVLHRRTHPDASDHAYLNTDSLAHVTVSAMAAGGVLSFFTSPLLVVKTKQQIMEWNFKKAFMDTVRHSSSSKSIPSRFYVGFGPHCVAEVCGRGIYFYSYETLKRSFLQNRRGEGTTTKVSLPERCVSAALSGILCWTIIFPFDALRSRMYAQELSTTTSSSKSSWEMAKSMYREHNSVRPFFRGFGVTVLRAGPVAATVLPIYDTTLEWLSRDE